MTDMQIIEGVIHREGGYVNHPADRGGPTKYGITLGTLKDWRRSQVTLQDVKDLSLDEAKAIYLQRYIVGPGYNRISYGPLRALVVDMGVHHGPSAATEMLQRAVGVTPDRVFGPTTEAAVNSMDGRKAYLNVLAERAVHFGRLISNDHSQAVFAHGWMNRLAEWIRTA